jgi:GTPase SAR1 family protein
LNEFLEHCDGFLLCFDLTNTTSFKNLNGWLNAIKDINPNCHQNIILVGNKSDVVEQRSSLFYSFTLFYFILFYFVYVHLYFMLFRQVQLTSIQELSLRFSLKYLETSASTAANVEKSFFDLAHKLLKQQREKQEQGTKIASTQPFKIVLLGDAGMLVFVFFFCFICFFVRKL